MLLVVFTAAVATTVLDDIIYYYLNKLGLKDEPLFLGFIFLIVIMFVTAICSAIAKDLTRQFVEPIEDMAEHLDDETYAPAYEELIPFVVRIRNQHVDVLQAAKSRQDFSASVSHELKTPLTAISGYAELLENGVEDVEKQKHFAQEIKKNSDRLLSIINDIIRLSELDRPQDAPVFEATDLYDLVDECVSTLSVVAEQAGIELTFSGEHCSVFGSRENLKEVVYNLVQNAIKYNNPGGHVWVSVYTKKAPTISVKDDGIGIPDEDQDRIFERFYRVDKSRSKETGGTGLGLSIVKHIVELHKATITLDSELGEGSEFKVVF